jgi:acyl-CoA thioesterase-1
VPIYTETAVVDRTNGNRVSMLGDSVTIGNSLFDATNHYRGDKDPLNWASILSNGKMVYKVNAGIGGNNAAQMLARLQADIIAPGCDVCVVMSGSNDAQQTVSLASYAASITGIVAGLRSAGIAPVLCTSPPLVAAPVTSPTRRRLWDSYNAWLATFCHRNSIPLVPIQYLLTDPANADYLAAYSAGDGYHPNAAGARVMGQALADAVSPLLGSYKPPIALFETADALNLMAGGLFLVDTNTDGTADNWIKSGSGVATVVTDAAIVGKWQRLTDTVSETTQIAPFPVPTGWAIGDKLAMAGRFRNDSVGGTASIQWYFNGSGINVRFGTFSVPVPDTLFYMEFVVPAGTTSIQPSLLVGGSTTLDARMAQMKLLNLTAMGLA